MGNQQATVNADTLVAVLEQYNSKGASSADLRELVQNNATTDFVPNSLSDFLILVLSGLVIAVIMMLGMIQVRLRRLENNSSLDDAAHRSRFQNEQFRRLVRTVPLGESPSQSRP